MKKIPTIWFGCPKCFFKPLPDSSRSTKAWTAYKNEDCPDCGTPMKMNVSEDKVPESIGKAEYGIKLKKESIIVADENYIT